VRRPLTLVALGLAALLLQGGIATHVPRAYVPDLAFLIVVTCGLHLPGVRGLLVVAWLGYTADLLSGAPLGEHAVLWVGLWGLTGIVNRRLDLRRVPPLMVAVAAFTLAETAAFVLLQSGVLGLPTIDTTLFVTLGWQILANTLAAPLVWGATVSVLALTAPEEGARRTVRLDTRRPVV
jgi:rod shape-determining protein MreD